jgi:signal transduction histidine kinase
VIRFVRAERGFILLVDAETGRVWGEAVRNLDKAALEATLSGTDLTNRAEISTSVVETVLDSAQPLLTHNAMEDPRFASRQSVQFSHLRSVLCVPLMTQGRVLGIIYLDNRAQSGIFTDKQLTMLSAFANQAAVAMENARLYENLRKSLEERLRLQDELHRQETKRLALEEASRLKSDFIGFVAHELRNPLTSIRGFVQTMLLDEEAVTPDMAREFHETIEAESDRLLDMINELLDVSRLEAGRPLTLALKPVELRPMMEKLVRRQKFSKFYTSHHELKTEFDPNLPETLNADEDKLNQILSNLLSNAVKYSPNGGAVTLSAKRDGDNVAISVSDEGVGLTPEQQARLFRQYERAERDAIKNIPGTGLGLYLVKSLAELHGGTIGVNSEPGRGSTFTVMLPLR